ncbi:MAG: hypothetical protein KF756_01290 [Acidobacteria bacterium]|nr:hypothetical protein [Acidobacteriota bacterium]
MRSRFLFYSIVLVIGLASAAYAQRSEWPVFKKGEDYSSVRKKLEKAGWTPYRRDDADTYYDDSLDANGKQIRSTYPELNTCSGTGVGYCTFTWLSPRRRPATITTVGGDEFQYSSRSYDAKQ